MKKIVSLVMSVAMCLALFPTAYAIENSEAIKPNVVLNDPALNVPNEVIQDIIKDNPDAKEIIIYDYYEAKKDGHSDISTRGLPKVEDLVKITNEYDAFAKDEFVTSVAKGQSVTLSSKWTGTLQSSISGECTVSELSLLSSITKEYSTSFVFTGPPESSSCNSREYRVKFYENRGTYTARRSNGAPGCGGAWRTVSGNWSEPSKYAAYSVDKRI